jgi:prepilin peptidase CpaA
MSLASLNLTSLSLTQAQLNLVLPLLLALWMAWSDMRTNRIPNYLTLGCALAGLGYQLGFHGLAGVSQGLLGMALGFGLLILFYWKGGMGAGDVKALAALGAWLGPWQTLNLFIYMAFSGVLVIVAFLWWRGLLWGKIRQLWEFLVSWVLLRPHRAMSPSVFASASPKNEGIPYALALALGMAILCWQGFTSR